MKRITVKTIIMMLVLFSLLVITSGCDDPPGDGKISVVCTVFPQYDWTAQILGEQAENINLTLLLKNKIDLHSYQPTVADMAKISRCDIFIYVGGESDGWVEKALKKAKNKNMIVINLLDVLGDNAKIEEPVEGAKEEEEPLDYSVLSKKDLKNLCKERKIKYSIFAAKKTLIALLEEADEEDEKEYDEHVWLSLKNAAIFCDAIAEALSSLDADNAEEYQSNLAAYKTQLAALYEEFQAMADEASVKTLLFGDRFPFCYLVHDYGFDYYAAFSGCSANADASPSTILFLRDKVDELELKNIMVTESSDKKTAEAIRNHSKEKNQKILVLNAMQSVTINDVNDGTTYLSIMEYNLNVLKEASK